MLNARALSKGCDVNGHLFHPRVCYMFVALQECIFVFGRIKHALLVDRLRCDGV